MDHPLLSDQQKDLRRRVVHLFLSSYSISSSSNIIFVCGGNCKHHMRMRFFEFCNTNLPSHNIFFPEFAIPNLLRDGYSVPFDLSQFEEIVAELSSAIVIFPEAPGSFAETGYFSAINSISKKTILVLDSSFQNRDGFISIGPAKKISDTTLFHPLIQIDYKNPDFSSITSRILTRITKTRQIIFSIENFMDLSSYELFCLIYEIVKTLHIATLENIYFILNSLFKGKISKPRTLQIISILIGSKYLREFGDFDHLTPVDLNISLLKIKPGFKEKNNEIKLELAALYQNSSDEFSSLFEESLDAA